MPFQSEKQRRYLWANEPEIARDWTDTYGSGIAKALGGRIGYQDAGPVIDPDSAEYKAWKKLYESGNIDMAKEYHPNHEAYKKHLEAPAPERGVRGLGALGRGLGDSDDWGYGNDDRNPSWPDVFKKYMSSFSSRSPHKGMPLSVQDREAYLAELLENDPASSLYDLSTVKDFSEQENPYRKRRMARGVAGYYSDDTAYVKDLDKLGTRVGPFKGSLADQELASVASHELTHPKVSNYGIDMSNVEEPRELPSYGYLEDKTYMPHEKNELLTRMVEMQNFPKASDAEWYFGESPYAISKHPSGAEGYEAGKILQKSLEPSLAAYNKRIESEKNPLIYSFCYIAWSYPLA